MPKSQPPAAGSKKKKGSKLNPALVSSAGIAIVFHAAILLIVGSVVIFEGKVPPIFFDGGLDTTGAMEEVEAPPMLEDAVMPEPDSGGIDTLNEEVPTDAIDLSDLVVTSEATLAPAFSMPLSVGNPNITVGKIAGSGSGNKGPAGFGLGGGGKGKVKLGSLFGSKTLGTGVLTGHLYDFKQDSSGQPTDLGKIMKTSTGTNERNAVYHPHLDAFLKDWDEANLSRYYRAETKLSTTQVLIPMANASIAPEAFGVADEVEPSGWVVLYKGKITPPQSGEFRFVGKADNYIFARVDGKIVFEGEWRLPRLPEIAGEKINTPVPNGSRTGQWFRLRYGTTYPIEILLSESTGGTFAAHLLIQQKGVDYKTDANGALILPPFQMAPTEIPHEFKGSMLEDAPFFGSE